MSNVAHAVWAAAVASRSWRVNKKVGVGREEDDAPGKVAIPPLRHDGARVSGAYAPCRNAQIHERARASARISS
jgi:hypothetical protein